MTTRTVRQRTRRESWPHYVLRLTLEALALLVAWLVVVSAAAAQQPANPRARFDPDFRATFDKLQSAAANAKLYVGRETPTRRPSRQ